MMDTVSNLGWKLVTHSKPLVNPWTVGNIWVHTEHCSYWCPGAKAPGHQQPQCWLNNHCIGCVLNTKILQLYWKTLGNIITFWKKKSTSYLSVDRHLMQNSWRVCYCSFIWLLPRIKKFVTVNFILKSLPPPLTCIQYHHGLRNA